MIRIKEHKHDVGYDNYNAYVPVKQKIYMIINSVYMSEIRDNKCHKYTDYIYDYKVYMLSSDASFSVHLLNPHRLNICVIHTEYIILYQPINIYVKMPSGLRLLSFSNDVSEAFSDSP